MNSSSGKKKHMLSEIWESNPNLLSDSALASQCPDIGKYLADILTVGPYYYYIINVKNYELSNIHAQLSHIHGFTQPPIQLNEIIDLIHPDDLEFVQLAEKKSIERIITDYSDSILNWKSSYCFRMRVADSTYHLFHHQAVHIAVDDDNKLTYALNIHTDIQHITQENSGLLLVQSLNQEKEYIQIDPYEQEEKTKIPELSKREMEILPYIANGHSSKRIADLLFISVDTVRSHRKNILKKTKTNSSNVLIKKCLEWGLL
ncbi:helix-turn-helix domain-containing protein [Sphingobacterium kyonggiense]